MSLCLDGSSVGVWRPRQLSLSTADTPVLGGPLSPALPSPRRTGPVGVDGVLGGPWMGMRRRPSDRTGLSVATSTAFGSGSGTGVLGGLGAGGTNASGGLEGNATVEEEREGALHGDLAPTVDANTVLSSTSENKPLDHNASPLSLNDGRDIVDVGSRSNDGGGSLRSTELVDLAPQYGASTSTVNDIKGDLLGSQTQQAAALLVSSTSNEAVRWRYKDEQGQIQGKYNPDTMRFFMRRYVHIVQYCLFSRTIPIRFHAGVVQPRILP